MKSDLDIYREEYRKYVERGDDDMNARCRIIEMGASEEIADAVQLLEEELDDA